MKAVYEALGVTRGTIMKMRSQGPDWSNHRRAAKSRAADAEIISKIRAVIGIRHS